MLHKFSEINFQTLYLLLKSCYSTSMCQKINSLPLIRYSQQFNGHISSSCLYKTAPKALRDLHKEGWCHGGERREYLFAVLHHSHAILWDYLQMPDQQTTPNEEKSLFAYRQLGAILPLKKIHRSWCHEFLPRGDEKKLQTSCK